MKKINLLFLILATCLMSSDNYYYHGKTKVSLTPANSMLRSNTNIDYYENDKKILMGVSNQLIVKLRESENLQNYLLEFNATIEKNLAPNLYIFKVEDKKLTLDIANRLSEKRDVEYAHPNFIKRSIKR